METCKNPAVEPCNGEVHDDGARSPAMVESDSLGLVLSESGIWPRVNRLVLEKNAKNHPGPGAFFKIYPY